MNYLDSIQSDEEIEGRFRYEMPDELKELFSNSDKIHFDVDKTYVESIKNIILQNNLQRFDYSMLVN